MKRRVVVLAVAVAVAHGCVKRGEYERGQTLGHVPCTMQEIRVTSEYQNTPAGNAGYWSVECRGVQYQCAQQVGDLATYMMAGPVGMAVAQKPVECQPVGSVAAVASAAPPVASAAPPVASAAPPVASADHDPPAQQAVTRPLLDSDLASGPVVGDATVKILYAPNCADYQWLVSSKRERAVLISSVSAAISAGYSWARDCTPPGR